MRSSIKVLSGGIKVSQSLYSRTLDPRRLPRVSLQRSLSPRIPKSLRALPAQCLTTQALCKVDTL